MEEDRTGNGAAENEGELPYDNFAFKDELFQDLRHHTSDYIKEHHPAQRFLSISGVVGIHAAHQITIHTEGVLWIVEQDCFHKESIAQEEEQGTSADTDPCEVDFNHL